MRFILTGLIFAMMSLPAAHAEDHSKQARAYTSEELVTGTIPQDVLRHARQPGRDATQTAAEEAGRTPGELSELELRIALIALLRESRLLQALAQ